MFESITTPISNILSSAAKAIEFALPDEKTSEINRKILRSEATAKLYEAAVKDVQTIAKANAKAADLGIDVAKYIKDLG